MDVGELGEDAEDGAGTSGATDGGRTTEAEPRSGHRKGRTMTGKDEGRRKRKRVGEDGRSESDEEQGGSGEVGRRRSERIRLKKAKLS